MLKDAKIINDDTIEVKDIDIIKAVNNEEFKEIVKDLMVDYIEVEFGNWNFYNKNNQLEYLSDWSLLINNLGYKFNSKITNFSTCCSYTSRNVSIFCS